MFSITDVKIILGLKEPNESTDYELCDFWEADDCYIIQEHDGEYTDSTVVPKHNVSFIIIRTRKEKASEFIRFCNFG